MSVKFNTNAVTKDNCLYTKFAYESAIVEKKPDGVLSVTPTTTDYEFKVDLSTPKTV